VAGSSEAAQALGSHLAGLNTYLAEHQTPVQTLTLSSSASGLPGSGWAGGGMDGSGGGQGAGQQMQQGTGQQPEQDTAVGFLSISPAVSTARAAAASPSSVWSGPSDGSGYAATSAGGHISVVA